MSLAKELAVREPGDDDDLDLEDDPKGGEVTSVEIVDEQGFPVRLTIDNALEFFKTPKGLEPFLTRIRTDALEASKDLDISRADDRKGIARAAYKVSRSKTAVDKLRRRLTQDQKAQLNRIDSEGKRFKDECDKIRDEIRKPLTDWEKADELRIATHEANLKRIMDLLYFAAEPTVEELRARLATLTEECDQDGQVYGWEEFAHRASKTIAGVTQTLSAKLAEVEKRNAEEAERQRLAAEQAQKEREEREERIRQEAAAKATAAAEARVRAEADAERARDAQAAEARWRNAEALRVQEAAVAEQRRQHDVARAIKETRAEQAPAPAPARPKKPHKDAVHSAIQEAMLAVPGITTVSSAALIKAMAAGKIPHVRIEY